MKIRINSYDVLDDNGQIIAENLQVNSDNFSPEDQVIFEFISESNGGPIIHPKKVQL